MELVAPTVEQTEQESAKELPQLRQDLHLHEGARNLDGQPTWLIHDPVRNRYFQLDRNHLEMVRHWNKRTAGDLRDVLRAAGKSVTVDEINEFARFLVEAELAEASEQGARARLQKLKALGQKSWSQRILHGYLFFRIPLVHPDKLLAWLYPLVRPLISPGFVKLSAVIGMLSLILISQRWDSFTHSLSWFFSPIGLAVFIVTLAGIKVLHELGHALMLRHYGLSVPTMGIAFMVMWPVLYTDATNAWRLPRRRDKALISAAGVMTELMLACYAMAAWLILPEGLAKSVAFAVATTTWVLSLAVNLNPLMRFDGYFFLSDILNFPNLQERSFALARWQIRRWLFGYDAPVPEVLSGRLHRFLVGFAISVWVYRFFLFLGIALLVYHFFFKLLGVVLFLVEIWYFILRPIRNELVQWHGILPSIGRSRRIGWFVFGGGLLLLLLFPFRQDVVLPAQLMNEQFFRVYPAQPAQVAGIHVQDGEVVDEGQLLITLSSPDTEYRLTLARKQAEIVRLQLAASLADEEKLAEKLVLEQALQRAEEEIQSMTRIQENLVVRAPFAGQIRDLSPDLAEGQWMTMDSHLFTVRAPERVVIHAWAREAEIEGLTIGAAGRYYPHSGETQSAFAVTVDEIESSVVTALQSAYQASVYGGDIPVTVDQSGLLVPAESLYRIHLSPDQNSGVAVEQISKGHVRLRGERSSLLSRFFVVVAGTVIREAGF